MRFTPKEMRRRFHLASAEAEAIRAKSAPLRAARDALVKETEPKIRALNEQIKEVEKSLYDLDVERATIAKALREEDGKSRLGTSEDFCSPEELAEARKG